MEQTSMFRKIHLLKPFGSIRKDDYISKSSSARKVHVTRVPLRSRNRSLGNHVSPDGTNCFDRDHNEYSINNTSPIDIFNVQPFDQSSTYSKTKTLNIHTVNQEVQKRNASFITLDSYRKSSFNISSLSNERRTTGRSSRRTILDENDVTMENHKYRQRRNSIKENKPRKHRRKGAYYLKYCICTYAVLLLGALIAAILLAILLKPKTNMTTTTTTTTTTMTTATTTTETTTTTVTTTTTSTTDTTTSTTTTTTVTSTTTTTTVTTTTTTTTQTTTTTTTTTTVTSTTTTTTVTTTTTTTTETTTSVTTTTTTQTTTTTTTTETTTSTTTTTTVTSTTTTTTVTTTTTATTETTTTTTETTTTTTTTETTTSTTTATETTTITTTTVTTPVLLPITSTNEIPYGIGNTLIGGDSTASTPGNSVGNYFPSEEPDNILDKDLNSIYTNFGTCDYSTGERRSDCGVNTGFYLTLQRGTTCLAGFRLCTATDLPERDPITITIEGSNQTTAAALTLGSSWTFIYSGSTGLMPDPGRGNYGITQYFSNSISYLSFRILVTSVRNVAEGTQYAEIELIGY